MTEAPAAPARNVRLSRSDRRAQLLVAAREVFAAQGYHSAAMDDIAERAASASRCSTSTSPASSSSIGRCSTTSADDLVDRVARRDRHHVGQPRAGGGGRLGVLRLRRGRRQAYRLVFESDLRGEPEAAAVVDGALTRCIDMVTAAVTTDAGLDEPRARLLAVGLVGLSQVAAQYWLDSDGAVPHDEAVALMTGLAWRGLAGFPMVHERPGD